MRRWRMWMQYKSELNQKRASAGEEKKENENHTSHRIQYKADFHVGTASEGAMHQHHEAERWKAITIAEHVLICSI